VALQRGAAAATAAGEVRGRRGPDARALRGGVRRVDAVAALVEGAAAALAIAGAAIGERDDGGAAVARELVADAARDGEAEAPERDVRLGARVDRDLAVSDHHRRRGRDADAGAGRRRLVGADRTILRRERTRDVVRLRIEDRAVAAAGLQIA